MTIFKILEVVFLFLLILALLSFTCDSFSSTFALRLLGLQARTICWILLLGSLWTDVQKKPWSTDGENLPGVEQKFISTTNQGNFQIHFLRKNLSGDLDTYCSGSMLLSPNRPKNIAACKSRYICVTWDLSINTWNTLEKYWPEHSSTVSGWLRSNSLCCGQRIPEGKGGSQLPWHQGHSQQDRLDLNSQKVSTHKKMTVYIWFSV